ncbi:MOSC domain-containing protein [Dickeya oryzae]|uniref:MOSC domain-containing protein n=1 Tax=Dickeya oryzae TaxID=1240404 RepID=A0AB39IZ36_9GAMM|nr:MOSC domain-containing protein [Dickeya oryzae]MBP2858790.1 MOSC domain-containing protein [Dickeya oryzae]MCA6992137.1 MOSC domain-containing protein [Dickeya oryzae]
MSIIEQLIYYPLKSGAGIRSDVLQGGTNGIRKDRQFCLYGRKSNKFMSLRENINIQNIVIVDAGDTLIIDLGTIKKSFLHTNGDDTSIHIWSREVEVSAFFGEVSAFLSSYLLEDVVLAKIKHPDDFGQSFMDTGPIHIIAQSELKRLAKICQLDELNPMIFRPNIIVSDFGEQGESDVNKVKINGVDFLVTERTGRCNAVTLLHKKNHNMSHSILLDVLDEENNNDGALFGLYLRADNDFEIKTHDVMDISFD